MDLKNLKDKELLLQTKELVKTERQILTKVLHHLREVERRKLFSDLGYQSLFEYSVKELNYSEGQAGRRIQAMRLIKEIPAVEEKIENGKLSLSNVSMAQSFFRETKKTESENSLNALEKLKIIEKLENKSAREGQRVLIKMFPKLALPKERERALSDTHTEIRFVITKEVSDQLEELRSLLGPKGTEYNMAELIEYMAGISIENIKIKKFGIKRSQTRANRKNKVIEVNEKFEKKRSPVRTNRKIHVTDKNEESTPTSEFNSKNPRYISKKIKHHVWEASKGQCTKCGGRRNLVIDHIKPAAPGGSAHPDNLRLLCFNCNQRQAIKSFGIGKIEQKSLF